MKSSILEDVVVIDACVCVRACSGALRGQKPKVTLELELQVAVSHQIRAQGIRLRASTKAVHTWNH